MRTRALIGHALAAATFTILAVGPSAHAGTFPVSSCDLAANKTSALWTYESSNTAVFTGTDGCATDSGLRLVETFGGPPDAAAGDTAAWTLTAAAGTKIRAARLRYALHVYGDAGWYAQVKADGTVLKDCHLTGDLDCYAGSEAIPNDETFPGLNADTIRIGGLCTPFGGATTCSRGATLHRLETFVFGAALTISDEQQPTVSLEASGLADSSGYKTVPGPLTSTAQDNTGVQRRDITIDNQIVQSITAPGAGEGGCGDSGQGAAYTSLQPCAESRGVNGQRTDTLDPSAWPQGAHQLRVVATDTGQNSTSSAPVSILIDTQAPPAPQPTAPSGWQNGQAPVSVVATDPAGGSPLATVSVTACQGASCTVANSPVVDQGATVALPQLADGTWSVTATVTDGVGHRSATSNPATLRIDKTAPALSNITPAGTIKPGSYPAAATATDTPSGVASVTYAVSVDGGAYTPATTVTATAGHTYRVQATATDQAGNRTTATGAAATVPATTPPTTTGSTCRLKITKARRTTTGKVLVEGTAPARKKIRVRTITGTRSRSSIIAVSRTGRYRTIVRRPTRSLKVTARVTLAKCTSATRRVAAR